MSGRVTRADPSAMTLTRGSRSALYINLNDVEACTGNAVQH
jgi:hypothetical protein